MRQFLERDILLIDPLQEQCNSQFQRLSDVERGILHAIATHPQPIPLETLLQKRSPSQTLNAIQSLQRRLLIQTLEREQTVYFTISAITRTYLRFLKT